MKHQEKQIVCELLDECFDLYQAGKEINAFLKLHAAVGRLVAFIPTDPPPIQVDPNPTMTEATFPATAMPLPAPKLDPDHRPEFPWLEIHRTALCEKLTDLDVWIIFLMGHKAWKQAKNIGAKFPHE